MGRHTQGHSRSLCKVKRSMKSSQSFKHDIKGWVTCSSTRSTGRATPQLMTHGYLMMTSTHPISLRNSMPKGERSKWLKGDESNCEDSLAPSYVFPKQQ
jgi:hypothetical protein